MQKAFLYIGITSLLMGCSGGEETVTNENTKAPESKKSIELTSSQIQSNQIETGAVVKKQMGGIISVTGTVEIPPSNKKAISFPFGGFVSSVNVLDGMNVKQGQVLMTIEDPALIQLQQDYMDAVAQLTYLKADLERQKELGSQGANSGKTIQMAQANYQSAVAKSEGLKMKLELAGLNPSAVKNGNFTRKVPVKAPFSGVVTGMFAQAGKYAGPSDVLMEVIDTKHTHVELFVFEKDIPMLRLNQSVELSLSGSSTVYSGKIYLIGKAIGMDKRVKVHCHLDKEEPNLLSGSYVQAKIHLDEQELLSVPVDAVVDLEGKKYVFVGQKTTKGMRFTKIEVSVLAEENGFLAISGNLAKSQLESIVLKGASTLMSSFLLEMQPNE